jgi:ribonucleoside-diphosphate reductase alpha chain
MAQDLLLTYKYGWKTSYYQNTYDSKRDPDVEETAKKLDDLLAEIDASDESECDACNV